MRVRRATIAAFAVNTEIAENGGPNYDRSVHDLKEEVDSSSGAKATLSRNLSKTKDENALQESAAHFVRLNGTREKRKKHVVEDVTHCVGG